MNDADELDDDPVDTTLTHDELVVLAALLRELIRTDGEISEEEIEGLDVVANRLGLVDTRWKRIWSQASRELPSLDSVKAAAVLLERAAAREFVYELLHHVASADEIVDPEWDLLEWIDEAWQARYG